MDWYHLAAAVATGAALHKIIEPQNVIQKLLRLEMAIKTSKVPELKIQGIDTRPKAIGLGVLMVVSLSAVSYWIISSINPSIEATLQYTVFVILFSETALIIGLDKYHVLIERITKSVAKTKKAKSTR